MNFHWLSRGSEVSTVEEIKTLSSKLEDCGYYSVLLTYHSKSSDMLIKSFAAASNCQKLKYMIAMRTYAISPEYLSMICKSYNDEFPNKLIFNIVSGDFHPDETSLNDVLLISKDLDTSEKRLEYTKSWMKKFKEIVFDDYYPEIIMAGHSEMNKEICNEFDATQLSMINLYKDYSKKKNKIINKKQMITFAIVIRDSEEEALSFIMKNSYGGVTVGAGTNWTIFGPKDKVKKEIQEMYNLGITDIMISSNNMDENIDAIHEVVKELILEEKI
jgi:alkanesulfonate monooxygenase SsuD/methylene tetrahydromethanopterin reductase-like flavin-dependent oxidoreductase (luciferase family)